MRLLLTGAGGFIGQALVQRLQQEGHELCLLTRRPQLQTMSGVTAFACDLAALDPSLEQRMHDFAPEMVIHAAWIGSGPKERNDPARLARNHDAAMQLMAWAARAGCRRWIGFGSQAEYSPDLAGPIPETAPTEAATAYGRAKRLLCEAQQRFAADCSMEHLWLRLFACYGPGQAPEYLVPYLCACFAQGRLPELREPHAVWDFLHVFDVADAVATTLRAPSASGVYNLASGVGVSVSELAGMLAHYWGINPGFHGPLHPPAAQKRLADCGAFCRHFAWEPRISWQEGLAALVACHA